MKKPWSGRFKQDTDESVERYTESVSFDWRLYREEIRVGIAHAEMLERCGLISESELAKIREGLTQIESEIEAGGFQFRRELEDIHMNVEAALVERVGEAGLKLHTARSRNDQVACEVRLWCRSRIEEVDGLVAACQKSLVMAADKFKDLLVPGFTHTQHAQPVLLGHVLLAYVEMFGRDRQRLSECRRRVNVSPLGACALAGTSLPIDVEFTAKKLGFESVFANSLDAVGDRDFAIEFVFVLSLIACHLSRLAEQWLEWSSPEFGFVDLDEAFCTGSSIMPQKKNPDVLELMRGKCGRVYGDLMALLTLFKGLPLAYNRDMQEDKEALMDATDQVSASLAILAQLVMRTTFKAENMARACEMGHMDATALAEYLVRRGMPFREAHQAVGRIARMAAARGVELSELSLEEFRAHSEIIAEDVYRVLGARNCIEGYRSGGSSSPGEVQRQIERWKSVLGLA